MYYIVNRIRLTTAHSESNGMKIALQRIAGQTFFVLFYFVFILPVSINVSAHRFVGCCIVKMAVELKWHDMACALFCNTYYELRIGVLGLHRKCQTKCEKFVWKKNATHIAFATMYLDAFMSNCPMTINHIITYYTITCYKNVWCNCVERNSIKIFVCVK